ncbi:GNAT family N-acetyltransferase [Nocardia sp. GCM10030253]|uniref:GNAT family N-acetyltransferase n=1 Tax=Nocardia sp. GCM10030253 TaxID=3273404 RepID=UPI0036454442
MLIRREHADDAAAIAAVHRSAFGPQYANGDARYTLADADILEMTGKTADDGAVEPPEVDLVARLRSDEGWIPTLSFVAIEHDRVIGHVCLTRAAVGPFPVLALGPIGVVPEHQGNGVGAALMHAALGAADALDEPLVALLGSLDYYPQFGFTPAARLGITPDEPTWVSHFQVRPLTAYESQIVGEFHYAEPFYEL